MDILHSFYCSKPWRLNEGRGGNMIRVSTLDGYENVRDHYMLTEQCKVVSVLGGASMPLKSRLNASGYVSYPLIRKGGGHKTVLLHRLVALAFVDNQSGYTEVNHINENKLDNRPENLEWCTHRQNCNHGTRNERAGEKSRKPVRQIDKEGKWVADYPSVRAATAAIGLSSKSAITNCIAGTSKSCAGHRWEYVG